ncbi:hypothetical protein [Neptuniibacter sp. QD37_11]|uniref:hypothetical protein n=1 Tax=Neptuniibacter sp. QD37_11 TaxID=3398209 RepID=UPI0039F49DDA
MNIDINNPPLTRDQLEAERQAQSAQVAQLRKTFHRMIIVSCLIACAVIVGSHIGYKESESLNSFYDNLMCSAVFITGGFALALLGLTGALDKTVPGKEQHEYHPFILFPIVGVATGIMFPWLHYDLLSWYQLPHLVISITSVILATMLVIKHKQLIEARNVWHGLQEAPKRSCLQIKEWLYLPEVNQFRIKVQAEARLFTNAEVDAMSKHYTKDKASKNTAELQRQEDEACRIVYMENLVGDKA